VKNVVTPLPLSRHSRCHDSTVLSRHRKWRDKTETLKNHNFFYTMSDEDKIYIKIVALDEIYNFVVLSFSSEDVKMLKKINM
jgi:hypothetical protein